MNVNLKVSNLEVGKRLDMKYENGRWSLWDGDELLIKKFTLPKKAQLGLEHYKVIVNEDGASVRVVRFADLHRHSDNSLGDGIIPVSEMVAFTEYAGALTDHGNMYGFLEFYKGMKACGKHPVLGFEAYQEDLSGKRNGNHLILLAKNNQGYRNLLKLTSEAYEHFYRKPHVTWDMLEQYKEGIICTSACLGGIIPTLLKEGNLEAARTAALRFQSIFGEDFYLEIQRHGIPEEDIVNPQLIALSRELNIPLIATTDAHYCKKEDAYAHEIRLCIQNGKTIHEPHRSFSGTGYHLQTSAEMEKLFQDLPEALDNTLLLAEKCNVEIPLGEVHLPNYERPKDFSNDHDYFEYLCKEGFQKRFAGTPHLTDPAYRERFQYEMEVITKMGFESYFIIVWDFINYARSQNIYIGPGRGSAAGSLLAYCIGITDIDPIRFHLLFERFLNPERVSWPDIDTDIEHVGRQKVIDYITKKYHTESVCRIVTFGTMAAKMVIKDVSRVLEYPAQWANTLAKLIPNEPKMTIEKAMTENPELRRRYESDKSVAKVIDVAKSLEGKKRHASQHACGVVISPGKVDHFLPTSMETDKETKEKGLTSQVTMSEVEELSLLKMDLLGLKNLTAIHEVMDTIQKTRGIHTTYQSLPLNDRETYQMLAQGMTGGVFQLESGGMTDLIRQLFSDIDQLPDERMDECFERLIAAVALYRPGPIDYIPDYIQGMRDANKIHYATPALAEILRPTYGVIVYQEQVMQIVQKLAGYSLGRADLVRKAMGKKKHEVMEAERQVFLYGNREAFESGKDASYTPGCIANGIPEEVAVQIWSQMEKFASYAFNRSHAACYAWLGMITAYMSCHWTPEFYCAMMNAFQDIGDKVKNYLAIAMQRGIQILPPNVNLSMDNCTVENGNIRLGFHVLSHLNQFGKAIVQERERGGTFVDYPDFYERMGDAGSEPNKAVIESLVFSGSLDTLGWNRQQLVQMTDTLKTDYKKNAVNRALDQISFLPEEFVRFTPPSVPEFSTNILVKREFQAIGFYLTRHPVDEAYAVIVGNPDYTTLTSLLTSDLGSVDVKTFGLVKDVRQLFTKNEEEMYTFSVEDRFNTIRCVLFPKRVAANKHRLIEGTVVQLIGQFTDEKDRGPQIVVQDINGPEVLRQMQESQAVKVSIQSKEEQSDLIRYVREHPGSTKVILDVQGKLYPISRKIYLTPESLNYLRTHFPNVSVCHLKQK